MADSTSFGMVNPAIFEHLQAKIDEDAQVREELKNILQTLEKQGARFTPYFQWITDSLKAEQPSLSYQELIRYPRPDVLQSTVEDAERSLSEQVETIGKLATVASRYPYYKYNGMWTRDIQTACLAIVFCGWLGGFAVEGGDGKPGRLLTIEEVGQILNVPVNLKDQDAFHLTIEEYLQSLISLIEELARLAVNAVTLGDYHRPLQISQFVKDLHAGFQILNLKNDSLRRRSDSIKYNVKKIEDVVYDLSLRNLIQRGTAPT
ncbi:hypothetical protein MMC16_004654 [Acarospora aff. strigata]|nr:hypothetical protein [Acarospora aff. strigata]